jgi:hypothetical protein
MSTTKPSAEAIDFVSYTSREISAFFPTASESTGLVPTPISSNPY